MKRLLRGEDRSPAATIVAFDREAFDESVSAAQAALEAARAEHQQTTARVGEVDGELVAAQKAFDADPSDAHADRLIELRRERERRVLFAQRTQRAVAEAEGAVQTAEQARTAALLEWLDDRSRNVGQRMTALWNEQGRAALEQFAAFARELDEMLAEAQDAAQKAGRLRGHDIERISHATMGHAANRSVVRSLIRDTMSADDRLRIERLVNS